MAKKPDLREALLRPRADDNVTTIPRPADQQRNPHFRPSRAGKTNLTGYFDKPVKKQLRLLAAERDSTIQALLEEALNDLFAKYDLPEIAGMDNGTSARSP